MTTCGNVDHARERKYALPGNMCVAVTIVHV